MIPHVYHKSFPDYITDTKRCKDDDLRIIPRGQHTRILIRCFNVMKTHLRRNILELGTPAQFMENSAGLEAAGVSDDQVQEKIPLELHYACVQLANHLEDSDVEDASLIKEIGNFANVHLVHWFEALSWIHKLDSAPRALLIFWKLLVTVFSLIHCRTKD
jgi:hypothetical protein